MPGPSDGDFGYWVRFNYTRDAETPGVPRLFQWRIPFVGAAFVRGPDNGRFIASTERFGDKGYVTYGKRESWYLASIETATHRAFMCVDRSSRPDGIGATDRRQTEAPTSTDHFARPWKLTGVRLLSKNALAGRSIDPQTNCPGGVPLVEAHLEYDNSLAPGAPNQLQGAPPGQEGKLTLKKVHFTHLASNRGRLSPYKFEYGETDPAKNPRYGAGERDRWGTYQPVSSPAAPPYPTLPKSNPTAPNPPLDDERTWTNQSAAALDDWSSAWALRRVVEPSGRALRVEYEADDYAYVQNQPATRMFPLVSVDAAGSAGADARRIAPVVVPPGGTSPGGAPQTAARPRVYFRLESSVRCSDPPTTDLPSCSDASAAVKARYLGAEDQILFKIRVALRTDAKACLPGVSPGPRRSGRRYPVTRAPRTPAWCLPPRARTATSVGSSWSRSTRTILRLGTTTIRLRTPPGSTCACYSRSCPGTAASTATRRETRSRRPCGVFTLVEAIPDIIKMLTGVYPAWAACEWGRTVDLAHSWIRLQDPDGIKKGGGARVRRLEVTDNWSKSTAGAESDSTTGYRYTYRLENGRSSGVAAYEPMIGGDENALRKAKPFQDEVLLSSSYNLFAELPNGESHQPAPAVGYARVVRRSLAAQEDITARSDDCGAGGQLMPNRNSAPADERRPYRLRVLHGPRLPRALERDARRQAAPAAADARHIPLLGTITVNTLTASQGYSTVINDMHGRPKRETAYEYRAASTAARITRLRSPPGADPRDDVPISFGGRIRRRLLHLNNAEVATLTADPIAPGRLRSPPPPSPGSRQSASNRTSSWTCAATGRSRSTGASTSTSTPSWRRTYPSPFPSPCRTSDIP